MAERSGRADDGGMTNNKQIVEQFITALFTDGDLTAVDRYLDPQFINHDPPLPSSPDGPEGMRQAAEIFRSAFPDWRSDQQHIIAEGDLVAEHFVAHGTHRGSVMGEVAHRARGGAPRGQYLPHRRRQDHGTLGAS